MTDLAPGPWGPPGLGNSLQFMADPLGFLERLPREFGDVARARVFGREALVLSNPEDIEKVLLRDASKYVKGFGQVRAQSPYGQGLLVSDGEVWKHQRRLVQQAYLPARTAAAIPAMTACAEAHLAGWSDRATLAIDQQMGTLTMAVFIKTLAGLDDGPRRQALARLLNVLGEHLQAVARLPIPIPLWVPTPGNLRLVAALTELDQAIALLVAERSAGSSSPEAGPQDLLEALMRARDENGLPMAAALLHDEVKSLFLAGHETTALLLGYALWLLAHDPITQDRLATEAAALGPDLTSSEDLRRLPAALQVVQETLRLYPPIHAMVRDAIETDHIRGFRVPIGTLVVLPQWTVQRDPRWFEAPTAFRPERWTDGFLRSLPRFAYFPFGGGSRLCIGNNFALQEATVLLATIVRQFRFAPVDDAPLVLDPGITLRPKSAIRLEVTRR